MNRTISFDERVNHIDKNIIASKREKSKAIYEASCKVIPGGVNSPVRAFPGLNLPPIVVKSGQGSYLFDVDGKKYLDFCMSWGALILGHAYPTVVEAASRQMAQGSSFGTITPYEEQLASKIIYHFPSIQKLRFVSSATEAVMSAIRLARGYTGKKKILKFNGNYHGHSDALLVCAGSGVSYVNPEASSKGIPQEVIQNTISIPYNDLQMCKKILEMEEDLAAVLLEPITGNMGVVPAEQEFIAMLREVTKRKKIILIFDEVITGFRIGLKGAQGYYGVEADLTCLGKIIGGGFPAAAFGGREEIMNHLAPLGQVYQGGTLSGNPIAMVAAIKVLEEIERPDFYQSLENKTVLFLEPIRKFIEDKQLPVCLNRVGSMFSLFFGLKQVRCREDLIKSLNHELFKDFFCYLFDREIYIPPSAYEAWFISSVHQESELIHAQKQIINFLKSI